MPIKLTSDGFPVASSTALTAPLEHQKGKKMTAKRDTLCNYDFLTKFLVRNYCSAAKLFVRSVQRPLVKSGKGCGILPVAIDCSESGVIAIQVAAS